MDSLNEYLITEKISNNTRKLNKNELNCDSNGSFSGPGYAFEYGVSWEKVEYCLLKTPDQSNTGKYIEAERIFAIASNTPKIFFGYLDAMGPNYDDGGNGYVFDASTYDNSITGFNLLCSGDGVCYALSSNSNSLISMGNREYQYMSFSKITLPISADWSCMAYGNDTLVILPRNSATAVYKKMDYDTYDYGYSVFSSTTCSIGDWSCVKWVNDRFIALRVLDESYTGGYEVAKIGMYSYDGIEWIIFNLPESADWSGISDCDNNGYFLIVAKNLGYAYIGNSITGFIGNSITGLKKTKNFYYNGAISAGGGEGFSPIGVSYSSGVFAIISNNSSKVLITQNGSGYKYIDTGKKNLSNISSNINKNNTFLIINKGTSDTYGNIISLRNMISPLVEDPKGSDHFIKLINALGEYRFLPLNNDWNHRTSKLTCKGKLYTKNLYDFYWRSSSSSLGIIKACFGLTDSANLTGYFMCIEISITSSPLYVKISKDGENWTSLSTPFVPTNVFYSNNNFIITNVALNKIAYTNDMNTWVSTIFPLSTQGQIYESGGILFWFIYYTKTLYFSKDSGATWSSTAIPNLNGTSSILMSGSPIYLNNKWIAQVENPYKFGNDWYALSNDLVTWETYKFPEEINGAIYYGNGLIILVGNYISGSGKTTNYNRYYISSNGIGWTRLYNNVASGYGEIIYSEANNLFIKKNKYNSGMLYSKNGKNWYPKGSGSEEEHYIKGYVNGKERILMYSIGSSITFSYNYGILDPVVES